MGERNDKGQFKSIELKEDISKGVLQPGEKYNHLTVVKWVDRDIRTFKSKKSKTGLLNRVVNHWEFKCDCGNTCIADVLTVKSGKRQSCGCKRKENLKVRNIESRKEYGEASRRLILNNYLYSAKKRNLDFELSEEQFNWITKQDCHYCGFPPKNSRSKSARNGEYVYNGIDRVDSSIGYVFDNCVPCCKFCNTAKKQYPVEEFENWLKFVVNNNQHLLEDDE